MEFSIIIPVYNVPISNLIDCVSSIRTQKFPSYEIIIVDDGSFNLELKNYLGQLSLDEDTRVLHQQNAGSAKARNRGLEKATGKYVIFVDADDKLENDFYKRNKKCFTKEFDVAFFNYLFWNKKEKKHFHLSKNDDLAARKDDIFANIMFYPEKFDNYFFGSIWGKCFSRLFLTTNNIRFENNLRKAQDRRFMMEVIYKAEQLSYYDANMYLYRKTSQSITHAINWNMEEYYLRLKNSFDDFCDKNEIGDYSRKFSDYGIFNEVIQLTVFHIDNKMPYLQKKNIIKRMYNEFTIEKSVKNIKYADMSTLKGKMKLFLMKHKLFRILGHYYYKKQAKERKTLFIEEKQR